MPGVHVLWKRLFQPRHSRTPPLRSMPAASDVRTDPQGHVADALARQPFEEVLRRIGRVAAQEGVG
ncbi:MAG: hypothetical protein BRD48_05210 [Bacteroidetes bacterium QS_9_68_14]|nr:MAG: hypothetical protein BRD48_05210 [Bacteroidetes bacterium QS_9_68_14]